MVKILGNIYIHVVRPIHVGPKTRTETSVTPTILHHILHALLFYRKTRIPSPLGVPEGPQGTLAPLGGPGRRYILSVNRSSQLNRIATLSTYTDGRICGLSRQSRCEK